MFKSWVVSHGQSRLLKAMLWVSNRNVITMHIVYSRWSVYVLICVDICWYVLIIHWKIDQRSMVDTNMVPVKVLLEPGLRHQLFEALASDWSVEEWAFRAILWPWPRHAMPQVVSVMRHRGAIPQPASERSLFRRATCTFAKESRQNPVEQTSCLGRFGEGWTNKNNEM